VSSAVQALDEQLRGGEGLSSVRIESIVRRAGIGIGSFCEYFSGKDALLGALIGRVTRENFD
jgi:AcrR family transcriptional regulator